MGTRIWIGALAAILLTAGPATAEKGTQATMNQGVNGTAHANVHAMHGMQGMQGMHGQMALQAALTVNVKEWSMRTSARSLAPGAKIVLRNNGRRTHVVALVRTNRAAGAFRLKAGQPQLGRVIARMSVKPGKTLRLTRRLAPGKYVLACVLSGHYVHGMHAGFRVVAAAPAVPGEQTLALATAGMLKFDRSVLRATAGKVTIAFTNKEKLPHNVALRGKGIDLKSAVVGEGTTVRLTATLAVGTYTFYCSVPGHESAGMRGTLTVTAAKGPAGAPGPTGGTPAPTPPADPVAPPPPAPAGSISIRAVNFTSFDRTSATAAPGPMTLALVNETPLPHNIALRGPGVSAEGPVVGQNGISTIFVTLAAGTYTFYCSVAGHEAAGMRGTLTVGGGGGGAPSPPPGSPPPGSPPPVNPAPPGTGTVLELTTAGSVAFDKTSLTAPAGEVTLRLTNTVSLDHNIALRGNGIDLEGSVVGNGGVSSLTANLAAGTYTFYCAVGGHEGAGMRGTLTVTGSGGGSPPPTNPPPGGGSTATLTVTSGFSFDQTTVRVKAGLVTLVLENHSSQWHGIAIKSHGVDVRGPVVGPGGTSRVSVSLEEDDYEFYCPVDGHRSKGMRGTLIVD